MQLAQRMIGIGTETAFEAAARARAWEAQGHDVIHLEVGEPDFDTPANIRDAAKRALDEGWTHYGPPLGQPKLREAIAKDSTARRGFEVDPANVVVTPGAKPIMFYALLALIDSGDEVVYPDPGFPIYESMTRYAGGTPKPYALREAADFRFDPDEVRALVGPRTKLIIINSPHNPTGGVLTREDIEAIADVARGRDIMVLADEIYGRGIYEGEQISIAALPGMAERTIVLDGFSKAYAMTGWRLGYAIVPPSLVEAYSKLIINSVSCTSSFEQMAAVEALTGPQDSVAADGRRVPGPPRHRRRRPERHPGHPLPNAARRFLRLSQRCRHGHERLPVHRAHALRRQRLRPFGTAFGQTSPDHIRISYANSQANLRRALERIEEVVAKTPAGAPA